MEKRIDLCGEWHVSNELGAVHIGMVPGCVHTDLFTNEEMFVDKNSMKCRFIEEHDWIYEKEFKVEHLENDAVLVFEGLDTYCDIYLNEKKVGSTENMFIPHRFLVDGILQEGENTLRVYIHSPIKAVQGKEKLSGAFTTERLHTRRMQCTYGWDWVDRFVTSGIFRSAYIVFENSMDLKDVYVITNNLDDYSAQVKVTEHFRMFEQGGMVRTEVLNPSGEVILHQMHYCEEEENVLYFDIEEPALWYPRPYGEQPLYTLRITVNEHVHEQKFGIRTVKILQKKDKDSDVIAKCKRLQQTESGQKYDKNEEYSCFIPVVNGVKVFCTGANWVPCEPFPSTESGEKITEILEKAVNAGINMIRVWGGGLFEKQHFYNECDRLGILVTQDFLMACGKYPEEKADFQAHLKAEAEFAATYLRNHPSLVWWSGDNENAVRGDDTQKEYMGRISARKVIAPVLNRLDYNRAFLFSSPYGGNFYASKTVGTTHNTQFLGTVFSYLGKDDISDYKEYWKDYTARFIAEEPAMGAVCTQSISDFLSKDYRKDSEMWLYHTKTNPGISKELHDIVVDFGRKLFGEFENWEDRCFKLRYLQYEWIRLTLSNARSNLWFNSGIIYWMLNDCWPAAIGWSIIDYYVREKAGYYGMKYFGQPVTCTIEKTEEGYYLHVSNILNTSVSGEATVWKFDLKSGSKQTILSEKINLISGCVSSKVEVSSKGGAWLGKNELLIAEVTVDGIKHRNWYKEGLPILTKSNKLQYQRISQGIEIWSEEYIHAVEIEGVENIMDNYFSLLPGEKKQIICSGENEIIISGYIFAVSDGRKD